MIVGSLVGVAVFVGVLVGVSVGAGVLVGVGVSVLVGVGEGVSVGVGSGVGVNSMHSISRSFPSPMTRKVPLQSGLTLKITPDGS